MGLGETVIVAGIGCRKDVATDDVLAALDAALAAHGRSRGEVVALATVEHKRDEQAVIAAAKALGLPLRVVGGDLSSTGTRSEANAAWVPDTSAALRFRDDGGVNTLLPDGGVETITRSERSLAVAGVASVSEHAALAAAGDGARLLGPRTALGHVTCALAEVAP